jgi:hypothetical protein
MQADGSLYNEGVYFVPPPGVAHTDSKYITDDGWGDFSNVSNTEAKDVAQKPFNVLTKADLHSRRDALIALVAEQLALPWPQADTLLRYLKYSQEDVDKFCSDEKFRRKTLAESGLRCVAPPSIPQNFTITCPACYDEDLPMDQVTICLTVHWKYDCVIDSCDGLRPLSLS